jgi:formylglycine-generating enzyme required for sulfatase activity
MAATRVLYAVALGSLFLGCSDRSASPDEQDTGTPDTGTPDTGTPDTGTPDANLEPSSAECGEVPPESAPMAYLPDQHFCIDRTEVTWGQYMAWLATSPSHDGLPAQCFPGDTFAPPGHCLEKRNVCRAGCDERPMVCVDWCDAHAYCRAMGKRLCGAIGGGSVPFDQFANAQVSQWFAACSSGGKYDYPYGNTFDPKACDGAGWQDQACLERGECPSLPVASLATCQAPDAPYRGVFDLSGNVMEWEDSCDWETYLLCRLRGGSNYPDHADLSGLRCVFDSMSLTRDVLHTYLNWDVGFRCCRDVEG